MSRNDQADNLRRHASELEPLDSIIDAALGPLNDAMIANLVSGMAANQIKMREEMRDLSVRITELKNEVYSVNKELKETLEHVKHLRLR